MTVTYVEEPQPGETQPLRTPVVTVYLNDANANADKGQTEGGNAFLYAFGCYACSEAPLQVLALKGGEVEDVSTEAHFRPAHAAWLREMIEFVPDDEPNGFLAGYVGEKIRLGEGKEAWDLMLKYYDHTSDWASLSVIGNSTKTAIARAGRSRSPSLKRSNACLTKVVIR